MRSCDVLVVGLGGMGSAAASHLATRGVSVIGLDPNPPAHALGSSHGRTRVIRKAYYEDPRYVPLLHRAYELWRALEAETGEPLLTLTGALNFGPRGHDDLERLKACVVEHRLSHEVFGAEDLRRRFPAFTIADDEEGLFETDGGVLQVERCVLAHLAAAARRGARLEHGVAVRSIEPGATSVRVVTDREVFTADRVVLAAGPWLPRFLGEGALRLALPLEVARQVQCWFAPTDVAGAGPGRFPVFIHFGAGDAYYGLPAFDDAGLKVARHGGGVVTSPERVERAVLPADTDDVRAWVRAHLPLADGPLVDAKVCLYTNTPDHAFLVGPHPAHERVTLLGGFSGHGFKFASALGEVAAELALDGRSRHDLGLFDPRRFA